MFRMFRKKEVLLAFTLGLAIGGTVSGFFYDSLAQNAAYEIQPVSVKPRSLSALNFRPLPAKPEEQEAL